MVDLTAKPYYLKAADIRWVEDTIAGMSLEEKVGQLFVGIAAPGRKDENRRMLEQYHVGGARYNPGSARAVQDTNRFMQELTRIPLLIPSNTEAGGEGVCAEGTLVAPGVMCGATGDPSVSYEMGRVAAIESAAAGCNWCFAPVVDIAYNWRNTVIQTRAFGDNPDLVLAHGEAFLRATAEQGVAACAKHFPGDGVDERDQHVLTSHNTMTPEAWDASYGRVYKGMIDAGVQTIMIGHIGLPEYSRRLVPGIRDQEILPATLAPEITTTLLRERLGFNGLVVTDASLMLGLTSAMPRERLVPVAIAAGCDMFLRFWDIEEDFGFMMQGVRNGTISQERLSEALHRILGTKAALGLHRKQAEGSLVPHESALEAIGCAQHRAFAVRAAAKGVTLVKDTARQLPLRPETHPRLKLFVLESAQPTPMARGSVSGFVKEELEAAGFEVDLQPTLQERMKGGGGFGFIVELMKKEKTKEFEAKHDAVLLVINQHGFAQQAAERLRWPSPMAPEAPWYVHNVPTIAISMNLPNHLIDIPMVKTYVNAYVPTREAFRAALARIMGEAAFEGQYSENVWCGAWDTRL